MLFRSSVAADLEYSLPTIKSLLGHSMSGSVTLGYIHRIDRVLLAAADHVAGVINEWMPSRQEQGLQDLRELAATPQNGRPVENDHDELQQMHKLCSADPGLTGSEAARRVTQHLPQHQQGTAIERLRKKYKAMAASIARNERLFD